MSFMIRSPWQVMYSSIMCLVIRDIQKKFISNVRSTRSMGVLWLFFEPMLHLALWIFIRQLMGAGDNGGLSLPLYVLAGVMPFMLTSSLLIKSTLRITAEKGLYMFRQIKPIDAVVSLLLSELVVTVMSYALILLCFWWLNIKWYLHHPILLIEAFFIYAVFLMGAVLILSVLGFFFLFVRRIVSISIRLLYIVSGIFIPVHLIPKGLLTLVISNPLFQCVELSRLAFSEHIPYENYGDIVYLSNCAVISLTIGLLCYVAFRQKIMTEIEQR
jgi:capsular polysaccharide transport system permease protein